MTPAEIVELREDAGRLAKMTATANKKAAELARLNAKIEALTIKIEKATDGLFSEAMAQVMAAKNHQ